MKNTPYLFDECKYTPEGMVSVSQLQTFLSCKKKWEYNYIKRLAPRVDRSYLTIGKLCHAGMQEAMQGLWMKQPWEYAMAKGTQRIASEHNAYLNETPLLDEEIPEIQQLLVDAVSVFEQAFKEFEPWKYEVISVCKNKVEMPALELHFKVPCRPTNGLHGYIDAILRDKETGFVWCTDYKFRKSLSPDDDEAFNIQNAVYAYACAKMGIEITGTMTWQHVNTPAADPQLLKNGTVSRTKIKTTWDRYADFCVQNGIDPAAYEDEMKDKLSEIEWFRATYEYRNEKTIKNIWDSCITPVAKELYSKKKSGTEQYRSLYPWNCKMCQYQSLCQAELRDYDIVPIIAREYVTRN